MRAHAAGLLCAVAAAELLIGHAVWLRRNDFVDMFVRAVDDSADGTVLAWVDWCAAVAALEAGRLPCSGSEGRILRIAASIAEGVPVDLGGSVTGLDGINTGLVARAVLIAAGHQGATDGAATVARR